MPIIQQIAYQQGTRPGRKAFTHEESPRVNLSQSAKALLDELFFQVRPAGQSRKFNYEPSVELIESLRPQYQERLDQNFRHPESIQLNGYSLHEFKAFYVALLIMCAIHEYICYPWNAPGQPIPISSLVMVHTSSRWIARICKISRLPKNICAKILLDLTLDPFNKNGSLCIYPFVRLDDSTLAVAPQFPLISAVDENILRAFSYRFPALFSAENNEKDKAMKSALYAANPGYHLEDSVQLPDKSTEDRHYCGRRFIHLR
jgi:hypothetical protein